MTYRRLILVSACLLFPFADATAKDFILTIGGGYSPSGNQASLENNVLFFQRLLREKSLHQLPHVVYFADGQSSGKDLQVMDRDAVPKVNRLMAEFFGSRNNLGLTYRNHRVPDVRGASNPVNIRLWFEKSGPAMQSGDRLILYVTAHGKGSDDRNQPHNTSISLWGNTSIRVSELVKMLDKLPNEVEVVAIMVQCHAGGFARFIFNEGDPDKGLSSQKRSGFFATVHDRPAAGCTAEVDEASYVEYSTYFWGAVAGHDRLNSPIDVPDYNDDGNVSFDEAHAYTILTANTIDLPICTSGEYLTIQSRFGNKDRPELLTDTTEYEKVLTIASPIQKTILEGLSQQLKLTGDDRLKEAWEKSQPRRGSRTRGRSSAPGGQLRNKISSDLKRRWPELANLLNPVAIELVTTRRDEFIRAVEGHADYQKYRRQVDTATEAPNEQKQRVKFERFLRIADNVILAENLKRMNVPDKLRDYEALVAAESRSLQKSSPDTLRTDGATSVNSE